MHIALYKPEIPQNTGNIGRLCYCTGSSLHIIGEPSFSLSDSAVKRAGLDYWDQLKLTLHKDWALFLAFFSLEYRFVLLTRFASKSYADYVYTDKDVLIFGSETRGLPKSILASSAKLPLSPVHGVNQATVELQQMKTNLRIPVSEASRSLNLSNSVAIVLYEALRQQAFPSLKLSL